MMLSNYDQDDGAESAGLGLRIFVFLCFILLSVVLSAFEIDARCEPAKFSRPRQWTDHVSLLA